MKTLHIDTPIGGIDGNTWNTCISCGCEFQGGGEVCEECNDRENDAKWNAQERDMI